MKFYEGGNLVDYLPCLFPLFLPLSVVLLDLDLGILTSFFLSVSLTLIFYYSTAVSTWSIEFQKSSLIISNPYYIFGSRIFELKLAEINHVSFVFYNYTGFVERERPIITIAINSETLYFKGPYRETCNELVLHLRRLEVQVFSDKD